MWIETQGGELVNTNLVVSIGITGTTTNVGNADAYSVVATRPDGCPVYLYNGEQHECEAYLRDLHKKLTWRPTCVPCGPMLYGGGE